MLRGFFFNGFNNFFGLLRFFRNGGFVAVFFRLAFRGIFSRFRFFRLCFLKGRFFGLLRGFFFGGFDNFFGLLRLFRNGGFVAVFFRLVFRGIFSRFRFFRLCFFRGRFCGLLRGFFLDGFNNFFGLLRLFRNGGFVAAFFRGLLRFFRNFCFGRGVCFRRFFRGFRHIGLFRLFRRGFRGFGFRGFFGLILFDGDRSHFLVRNLVGIAFRFRFLCGLCCAFCLFGSGGRYDDFIGGGRFRGGNDFRLVFRVGDDGVYFFFLIFEKEKFVAGRDRDGVHVLRLSRAFALFVLAAALFLFGIAKGSQRELDFFFRLDPALFFFLVCFLCETDFFLCLTFFLFLRGFLATVLFEGVFLRLFLRHLFRRDRFFGFRFYLVFFEFELGSLRFQVIQSYFRFGVDQREIFFQYLFPVRSVAVAGVDRIGKFAFIRLNVFERVERDRGFLFPHRLERTGRLLFVKRRKGVFLIGEIAEFHFVGGVQNVFAVGDDLFLIVQLFLSFLGGTNRFVHRGLDLSDIRIYLSKKLRLSDLLLFLFPDLFLSCRSVLSALSATEYDRKDDGNDQRDGDDAENDELRGGESGF